MKKNIIDKSIVCQENKQYININNNIYFHNHDKRKMNDKFIHADAIVHETPIYSYGQNSHLEIYQKIKLIKNKDFYLFLNEGIKKQNYFVFV